MTSPKGVRDPSLSPVDKRRRPWERALKILSLRSLIFEKICSEVSSEVGIFSALLCAEE